MNSENSGELAIGDITVDKDLLNISKEIVGASVKSGYPAV